MADRDGVPKEGYVSAATCFSEVGAHAAQDKPTHSALQLRRTRTLLCGGVAVGRPRPVPPPIPEYFGVAAGSRADRSVFVETLTGAISES